MMKVNWFFKEKPPKNRTERSKFLQKLPYLLLKKNGSNIPKLKIGSESLMLGKQRRLRKRRQIQLRAEGRKRLYKRYCFRYFTPLWNPKYEKSVWRVQSVPLTKSVGKCHVKINQSQSIRTEKHKYIRRFVAISPRPHKQFPAFLRKDGLQVIQSTKTSGTDRVLFWNAHPSSGFRILSKRHQVRAIMYEITNNLFTSL